MNKPMDPAHALFQEWGLYDRIGHANHMRHAEISATLRAALRARTGPLRVLDLGCGDGWMAQLVFAEAMVSEFTGIDLSAAALAAQARRPGPGTLHATQRRTLRCGDIAAELQALPEAACDVVFASFSLHHYPTAAKPVVLDAIARVLAPDGWLLWIDTVVDAGETRAACIERLCANIATWEGLAEADRREVMDHVRDCDHPETAEWMLAELNRRGFTDCTVLHRDAHYLALRGRRTNR